MDIRDVLSCHAKRGDGDVKELLDRDTLLVLNKTDTLADDIETSRLRSLAQQKYAVDQVATISCLTTVGLGAVLATISDRVRNRYASMMAVHLLNHIC